MEYEYKYLDQILKSRGLKPSHISKATGIASSTLSEWKKGKYQIKEDKVRKIADFLEIPVSDLRGTKSKKTIDINVPIDSFIAGCNNSEYYIDNETELIAQSIYENEGLRLLFDAAKDASAEDLMTVHQLLLALKRKEQA